MKTPVCLALLALAAAGCTHATLGQALASRPLALDRLKPARFDPDASSLTLEAPETAVGDTVELRGALAEALNAELDESTLGRPTASARFRARISASESLNAWSFLEWVPPLVWPLSAWLYLEGVDLTARLELGLQVGDSYYAAVGVGESSCSIGPRAGCFHEALGRAVNDALGKLQGPQRIVASEGQR